MIALYASNAYHAVNFLTTNFHLLHTHETYKSITVSKHQYTVIVHI